MRAPPAVPAPLPRGPLSAFTLEVLRGRRGSAPPVRAAEPLADDDLQLALYLCYEQHYSGWPSVGDVEWDPDLLRFRGELEGRFDEGLRSAVGRSDPRDDVRDAIPRIVARYDTGPSLSSFMARRGTVAQMREFLVHRSAYQLKEADPHTWAIPRVDGRAKRALVQIQQGEYGTDEPDHEMHSTLFARTMRALDLDDRCNAYVDSLPGTTLATSNLVSMLGLHRRWRGALVGHLAAFEMTSVVPMGRYSQALQRLGLGADARRFYDVHVLADVSHSDIALHHMAASLAADEPGLVGDVLFGAQVALEVESRFSAHLLGRWTGNATSLRVQLAA